MDITAIFLKPSPCRETYERLVGAKGQARRMATNKLDSDRSCDLHQYLPPHALDPILPAVREKKNIFRFIRSSASGKYRIQCLRA